MTSHRIAQFAVTTALAAGLIGGCASTGASSSLSASASASAATQVAMDAGKTDKAVKLGERAVLASPRDAAARAMLGHAYLQDGRFTAASQSFADALELGDPSPRTALALALTEIAAGNSAEAQKILHEWRNAIPAADFGLAMSLAGQTDRGVKELEVAIREGENTAKIRQNLAYAYALDGRWREARLMMAQDVPGNQIDQRISDWATMAHPQAFQQRIAHLLSVKPQNDAGQPQELALANFPGDAQTARIETPEALPALAPESDVSLSADAELPAIAPEQPRPVELASLDMAPSAAGPGVPVMYAAAPLISAPVLPIKIAPAPKAAPESAFVSQPVVQPAPKFVAEVSSGFQPGKSASLTTPRLKSKLRSRAVVDGPMWLQLGSYVNPAIAADGWAKFVARTPALRDFKPATTTAYVDGVKVYRVAASSFASYSDAKAMCRTVKSRGGECLVVNAPKS